MRKKINLIYSVFLSSIFALIVYSCAREEGIPVTADFSIKIVNEDYSQHFAKNLKPQSFQNQGIALFFLYFSQVRGLSRTLK